MLGFGWTTRGLTHRIAALASAAGPTDRRRAIAALAGWCSGDPFANGTSLQTGNF